MMPITSDSSDSSGPSFVEALRTESSYRTWFATILASTLAVVYLGSSFSFQLDLFPTLRPVGHFFSALVLFLISVSFVTAAGSALIVSQRKWSNVTALRTRSVRRLLREMNRIFGMRVVAVTFGGSQDGRMLAMTVKGRHVVGIARGALPSIVRDVIGVRFRIAHEYAHIASSDPRRERWLAAVYATAFLFLLIAYGSTLGNTLGVLVKVQAVGGWVEVKKALFGSICFGLIANLVLFASILVVMMLERRSAARLREFYADAVAAMAVGPVESVYSSTSSDCRDVNTLWRRLLGRHPEAAVRAVALTDRSAVYQADMMLFGLQGFFGAFVLEIVMQLLFTSASTGLASFVDRRESLWRYFGINNGITTGIILFGALLMVAVHATALTRLAEAVRVLGRRSESIARIASVLLFTSSGVVILIVTSQANLWDLNQTGWNVPRYIVVCWDRLALHSIALVALCMVTIQIYFEKPSHRAVYLAAGSLPAGATLLLGYFIYR